MKWLCLLIVLLVIVVEVKAQEPVLDTNRSSSWVVFGELGGKGFFSFNVGLAIGKHHRISFGLTALDYEVLHDHNPDTFEVNTWLSPGLMYYYLKGKDKHYLELGGGASISPFLGRIYDSNIHTDSPFSFHGVIGYRYQKKKGALFRVGFTPFYRPKVWFLPIIGVSFGYCW